MTQLSLFDSVATSAATVSVPAVPVKPPVVPVKPPVVRPSIAHAPLLPETSQVRPAGETPVGRQTSLRELAVAIYEGRQALRRTPESGVQRMGDLAKLVLERHDLVARRRIGRAAKG